MNYYKDYMYFIFLFYFFMNCIEYVQVLIVLILMEFNRVNLEILYYLLDFYFKDDNIFSVSFIYWKYIQYSFRL